MKQIDEPIQIVDGCLTCPHCAGDVVSAGVVGIGGRATVPCFTCEDCGEKTGLCFFTCPDGHTHIYWVEVPTDEAMQAENTAAANSDELN